MSLTHARGGLLGFVVVLTAMPSSADASPQSRALTREAYVRAYELKFAESVAVLERARRADASDPAPPRAIAAITWMEILFRQGVATFDAFVGEASADHVARPAAPHHLATRFLNHAGEAVQLSEGLVAASPADVDAQYQLGASTGLLALYRGTVEGRMWVAFVEGRRAVGTMERVRQANGDHREAALLLGLYRYAVSTLSWPKRMLASLAGMPGDRHAGIQLLETAADPRAETSTDASLLLMIVYNREGEHAQALDHLRRLRERHPGNRLLVLNMAATALAASDPAAAAETITAGLGTIRTFDEPLVLGERAMWFYIRGAARVSLSDPRAADDLRQSLASDPREWIRARTHFELARRALHSRDERQARTELAEAERCGEKAGDRAVVERARQLWRERPGQGAPYRPGDPPSSSIIR